MKAPRPGISRVLFISVLASAAVAVLMAINPNAALAAVAPANDTIGGATVVNSLPFNDALDTTGATTDAQDAQVNATCGAPATNASVWYQYTAVATDSAIVVDSSGSDYPVGIIVATGTPGALTTVTCAPSAQSSTRRSLSG